MGNPSFAISSLESILQSRHQLVAVISNPPKPMGRKKILKHTEVGDHAIKNGLELIELDSFENDAIYKKIISLNIDIFVVVAFKILPEKYISIPRFGSINLHASLLPKYRGAAPINWALINGEKETGVTTFLINEEIDTGKILLQKKIKIKDDENAGSIHDKLMIIGSDLICDTIDNFKTIKKKKQLGMPSLAPKIFKNDCKINWNNNIDEIFNKIRGLSPYPSAWCDFLNNKTIKILKSEIELFKHNLKIGQILSDNKTYLKFAAKNGFIKVLELQLEGKRKVSIQEFLRGYKI